MGARSPQPRGPAQNKGKAAVPASLRPAAPCKNGAADFTIGFGPYSAAAGAPIDKSSTSKIIVVYGSIMPETPWAP